MKAYIQTVADSNNSGITRSVDQSSPERNISCNSQNTKTFAWSIRLSQRWPGGPFFQSGIKNWSQGGAFVHNIIAGRTIVDPVSNRYTPYHFPHSTELMGVSNIFCGDDRIYNSIYIKGEYEIDNRWNRPNTGFGLDAYNLAENILPVSAGEKLIKIWPKE